MPVLGVFLFLLLKRAMHYKHGDEINVRKQVERWRMEKEGMHRSIIGVCVGRWIPL